ncbi:MULTISPECIES: hypothetical protein [unclassified Sphingomonas]|nr:MULTISPECIES: hypothetical protein [unclassified Sphingomonas]MCH4894592.1 hypothetical protein [Sphingomonas sp. SFZ2018-12]
MKTDPMRTELRAFLTGFIGTLLPLVLVIAPTPDPLAAGAARGEAVAR